MESGLTKQQIIAELTKSPHGDLKQYLPVGSLAATQDGEFIAHLIAWNEVKGQIRDSKVALPIASMIPGFAYAENSLAHLAMLDPRNLVRAVRFAKEAKTVGYGRQIGRMVECYLRAREARFNWWERTCLQHRESMKTLYALGHVKPVEFADAILFKGRYAKGTVFHAVANLKDMPAQEAAGTILERRIPFLVAVSALGKRAKETDLVLALIERMSPTELVTNTKMLERLGVKDVPALRGAYEAGLQKAAQSTKATFKTTRAAEALGDGKLKEKLQATQEKQIKALGGIDGNWLVLGDRSGSMQQAIEASRLISATLAKMVRGEVHLVFFDTSPRYFNATGKTYDEILASTKGVVAGGSTSIGCGVQYCLDKKLELSGIAIVSDGGENAPPVFAEAYKKYCAKMQFDPPVYFYRVRGQSMDVLTANCKALGVDLQIFDLMAGVDYHSLPNLVQTMRASRYSLIDEIMEMPLKTLDEVFNVKEEDRAA